MKSNSSQIVKNLLKATAGIVFAVVLVMLVASFIMDNWH